MRAMYSVVTEMRDGVSLSTNVYLPETDSPVPAVLIRTCYNKSAKRFEDLAGLFCGRGYALVANDVRGRGDSGGEWVPWESEFHDGYDTIEWIAAQPWCSGRVGSMGGSYEAWVQWAAADLHPPHLAAMLTSGSPAHWFRDWPYLNGAFGAADYIEWLNRTEGRTNQPPFLRDLAWIRAYPDLRTIDSALGRPMAEWQTCLDHPTYDAYWQRLAIEHYEQMDTPVLHMTGYYDACAPGSLHHFQEMSRRSPAASRQYLLIGAWNHGQSIHSGRAVDSDYLGLDAGASMDFFPLWLAWFDRWLKLQPNAVDQWPQVRYYAMGAGSWQGAAAWPPSDHLSRSFFLGEDGSLAAQPREPGGTLQFPYDPADPLCPFDNLHSKLFSLEWYPYLTHTIEQRADLLSFTSQLLEEALASAGPVLVELKVSSSAPDTDFVAILADVDPDGSAVMLSQGIVRAASRSSVEQPEPLVPGQTYSICFRLSDTAHTFRTGHRMRLLITSSLYPWFHPNPNTGQLFEVDEKRRKCVQTIFCGGEDGSRLILHARKFRNE